MLRVVSERASSADFPKVNAAWKINKLPTSICGFGQEGEMAPPRDLTTADCLSIEQQESPGPHTEEDHPSWPRRVSLHYPDSLGFVKEAEMNPSASWWHTGPDLYMRCRRIKVEELHTMPSERSAGLCGSGRCVCDWGSMTGLDITGAIWRLWLGGLGASCYEGTDNAPMMHQIKDSTQTVKIQQAIPQQNPNTMRKGGGATYASDKGGRTSSCWLFINKGHTECLCNLT